MGEDGEDGGELSESDDDREAAEDVDVKDCEVRSDGDVYEIMLVVEIRATGAEICARIDARRLLSGDELLLLLLPTPTRSRYLEPFLVSERPRVMMAGWLAGGGGEAGAYKRLAAGRLLQAKQDRLRGTDSFLARCRS